MEYKVRARIIDERMSTFCKALTDGTVLNQQPDGREIVSSMKRAKLTGPGIIEWYETCYCPSPLEHERQTVFDQYLTDLETELVDQREHIEGESFWAYLEQVSDS